MERATTQPSLLLRTTTGLRLSFGSNTPTRLAPPTSSTPQLVQAALKALEAAWADGYEYRKAGVLLLDLVRAEDVSRDLFSAAPCPRPGKLMQALDEVNRRFGRDAVRLGLPEPEAPWQMRQDKLTPFYTTRWTDIPTVSATL